METHPDLEELVAFVEAKEAGKRSQNALGSTAGLSKISQYRREKTKDKVSNIKKSEHKSTTDPPCGWCGEYGHGRRAAKDIRKSQCPAYKHTCGQCGILGHFEAVCMSKWKRRSPYTSKEEVAALDTFRSHQDFIGGIEFAEINGNITLSHAEYDHLNG